VLWECAAGPLQGALTLKQQVWLIRNHEKALHAYRSEPHTGARPSVRLCVGPELARCVHLT
jgi:hypothetical protein